MYPCKHSVCPLMEIELIALTQGKYAIVDKDDYEKLSKLKWHAHYRYGWYARTGICTADGKRTTAFMHRQLLSTDADIDHQNRNGLDNRRRNLRPCNKTQNMANRPKRAGTSSRFKGVFWWKRDKNWRARIQCNGHVENLGYYESEVNAALAYNYAARQYFGEFACLNHITPSEAARVMRAYRDKKRQAPVALPLFAGMQF